MVTKTQADTPTDSPRLVITRRFAAPCDLVWRAWTEPTHLMHWLCPRDFTVLFAEVDLREGGRWRSGMESPEGDRYTAGGSYRVVDPPHRLVMTHRWEGESPEPDVETLVTVTLTETDGQTEMRFEQVGFGTLESRDSHQGGWSGAFDLLANYVDDLTADRPRDVQLSRCFPSVPVEALWKAFSDANAVAAWFGPRDFSCEVDEYDFRVGGRWASRMIGPDGQQYPSSGEFTEIVPGQRLVLTDTFEPSVQDVIPTELPGRVLVTILFESYGPGSRLTLRTQHASPQDRARNEAMGMIRGWHSTLDCLQGFLTQQPTARGLTTAVNSSRALTMLRTFAAPREAVYTAQTQAEQLCRWCLGPPGWTMPVCEEDARPGGNFRWEWHNSDGPQMVLAGSYREVTPPERLVRVERFETGCPDQSHEQIATLVLTESGGETELSLTLEYPMCAARDGALASGMDFGMSASYDRLAALLAGELD